MICDLSPGRRVCLLTGPNMAGKSTFLRQNALMVVLAQAGLFVPAEAARLGLVDRLFSRVGAADDLAGGRSTFMVEMTETAAILNQAGPRSLVVLDEVGRGTATWDGLAIAWAVLEALHDRIRCRTIFATHFHELTALADRLPELRPPPCRCGNGAARWCSCTASARCGRAELGRARRAHSPACRAPVLTRAAAVLEALESSAARGPDAPPGDCRFSPRRRRRAARAWQRSPGDGLQTRSACRTRWPGSSIPIGSRRARRWSAVPTAGSWLLFARGDDLVTSAEC